MPELASAGEPSGGPGTSEAEVARWLAGDGEHVAAGDAVLELALDKANVTVAAPAAGILRHGARPGDVVAPGDVVGAIEV